MNSVTRQFAVGLFGCLAILFALWHLEQARAGLVIEQHDVGTTPVTVYRLRKNDRPAPTVVITHGFAGSRQLMEAYALTLARAGYVAVSFDFEGHGRNLKPMSGDVTRVDGSTQRLMAEIGQVPDNALNLPYADGRVVLLGHSMASDIIVRQAKQDRRIEAVVAISMFSEAVTANEPRNLLVIVGEWEKFLRTEALKAARKLDANASEGETVGTFASGNARRAVIAPSTEHVTVLYSQTALREARDWIDGVFGQTDNRKSALAVETTDGDPPPQTGPWILLLLTGIVALAWPASKLLPAGLPVRQTQLPLRTFLSAALLPAVLTPVILAPMETRFLPVLVADYLALHFLVYAMITAIVLWRSGAELGRVAWVSGLGLAAYGILVFGGAIDRYVASFVPTTARLPVIVAITIGTVPFMVSDSLLSEAGRAPLWRTLLMRSAFLVSLGLAVALDFERLFFLIIIMPVIIVFYFTFGIMGGWVGRRTKAPLAAGLGMGITLAWALGVTFPMFVGA